MKKLITFLQNHLRKYFVSGQFKKEIREIQRNKKQSMCKFSDFGVIGVILTSLVSFLTKLYHRPLAKIRYFRHNILTKNIISNKVVEIYLVKKDKSDINRQIKIDTIKFCFHGFDKNNKEFVDNLLIERIDDNVLVFKENDDIDSYKIRIPFEFSLKYFDAKKIKLSVLYKTPLDDDFIVHDREVDLTEITDNFKLLINRQNILIKDKSSLTKEQQENNTGLKIDPSLYERDVE